MSLPVHPLADLFPLIEGVEFDELVASIKAHGLHDPITMLDGEILDGRNRYRACQAAGVEPRFETFTGDDPYAFVIDKNIHRRHINESQRALIAARMATLEWGSNQHKAKQNEETQICVSSPKPPTVHKVAELMNVSPNTVIHARKVLREGTEEEVRAVERGEASVYGLAMQMGAKVPKEERVIRGHETRANQQRLTNQQMNAQVWGHLRDALALLQGLPSPADAVRVARIYDKRANIIDARILPTIQYLKDFSHEWSNRNGSADQEEQASGDHPDAGVGDRAA